MFQTTTKSRRGFTLLEVMVVAVIVVLMLGMALPVFRAITGSRSEAGAANHIAAMLSRARADAVGLQKTMGVAFIMNAGTQAQGMAEVDFPDCTTWTNLLPYNPGNCAIYGGFYYYCVQPSAAGAVPAAPTWQQVGGPPLEIRQDTDVIPLPAGIGVQTVSNCTYAAGKRTTDGYLNLGVILFDGQGHMTCQNYGICPASKLAISAGIDANKSYPDPAQGIYYPYPTTGTQNYGVPSQFGLVVFQREAFIAQGFPTDDPYYFWPNNQQVSKYTSIVGAKAEEDWLDQNATPLVIDRYTGTLIRAE